MPAYSIPIIVTKTGWIRMEAPCLDDLLKLISSGDYDDDEAKIKDLSETKDLIIDDIEVIKE